MIDLPSPPTIRIAPPVVQVSSSSSSVTSVQAVPVAVAFVPVTPTCSGIAVPFARLEKPLPAVGTRYPGSRVGSPPARSADLVFGFRIDASGRPLGVKRERADSGSGDRLYADDTDVEPSLAASRFAPGAPRAGYEVTYRADAQPIAGAPVATLAALLANDRAGSSLRMIQRRLRPGESTCAAPEAQRPLVLVYTRPNRMNVRPGAVAWTTLTFDIDGSGRGVDVRTIAWGGSETMDREARRALGESRFHERSVRGCVRWYNDLTKQNSPAPPRPGLATFARAGDSCMQSDRPGLTFPVQAVFPTSFRRRALEGWAVVRYDVAPWGELGNIEVLAAEPAAAFGAAAVEMVRRGRIDAGTNGSRGCLVPISFRMADDDGLDDEPG